MNHAVICQSRITLNIMLPLRSHLYSIMSLVYTKKTQTRKQKHHLEGNAVPTGYCHAHMLLYVSGVNYNVNSNYTKYLAQLCCQFFAFWIISAANLRILWRHLPTEQRNV